MSRKPTPVGLATRPATERPDPPADASAGSRSARQSDGRKGILVRAKPEAWKALKLIALDREGTLQDVMTEAINDVLAKHGKPPVA